MNKASNANGVFGLRPATATYSRRNIDTSIADVNRPLIIRAPTIVYDGSECQGGEHPFKWPNDMSLIRGSAEERSSALEQILTV